MIKELFKIRNELFLSKWHPSLCLFQSVAFWYFLKAPFLWLWRGHLYQFAMSSKQKLKNRYSEKYVALSLLFPLCFPSSSGIDLRLWKWLERFLDLHVKLLLGCLWWPIFARRRRVISARLKNRFGFRLGTNTDLFRDVVGPITMPNNYLNKIFDDVISLCWSCRNNARPRSPREKLNTCCKSLPNKLFVDRPSNRNIFTWIVIRAFNAISDRNW